MNPKMLQEELSVGIDCDTLLAGCQNGHLRELINNHKYTVIPILGLRKTLHVIHVDGVSGLIWAK